MQWERGSHRDTERNDARREKSFCAPSDGKEGLGWGPQPLCWGGHGRPSPHWDAPWASCAPGEFGLGRKQPAVSPHHLGRPRDVTHPPVVPAPSPHARLGILWQSWGGGGGPGPRQLPKSRAHQHVPPVYPGEGGQTLAASPLTLARGRTMKAPPPPDSTMMATNLGLTAQKELSHVTLETRMSSYIWSAFTGCPKTCRNLLWRTTRRLMAGGCRVRLRPPPCYSMEGFWPPSGLALRDTPPYPGHSGRPGDTEMMRDAGWCPMWSRPRGRDRG